MKRSSFFTILGGAFLCIVFFSSCKNFLKASSIREEIEEYIAYANSDSYKIIFKAEKNSGIITKPAGGEISAKVTDTFIIAFNAESDHEFIRWEIFDAATNTVIPNNDYLKIEDLNAADTTCKFLKAPDKAEMKLAVRAIVTDRPQIIRRRPADTPEGVLQNSAIEIIFDHDMDKSSIYYSTEEKNELKNELGLADTDFLADDTNIYGYKKEGKKYYKNISITNNKNNENLLSYFGEPFFADSRTLIIRPLNPPPEPETDILCTFNKDFSFLYDDNTPICMRETEKLFYSTKTYKYVKPRLYNTWAGTPDGVLHMWSSDRNLELSSDGTNLLNPYSGDPTDYFPVYSYDDSKKIKIGFIIHATDSSGCCLKKSFSLKWWKLTLNSENSTVYTPEEISPLIPFESFSEDYSYASCGYGESENPEEGPSSGFIYSYYDILRSSDFCSTKGLYCFQLQIQNNQTSNVKEITTSCFYYCRLTSDYSPD